MEEVVDRKHYYTCALRNGYVLPKLKSPFVSLEWLLGVVSQVYWCPTV